MEIGKQISQPASDPDDRIITVTGSLDQGAPILREYLISLPGESTARVQRSAADTVSRLLSDGRIDAAVNFPWSQVRARHLVFLRGIAPKKYSTRYSARLLSVARGILRILFLRGMISPQEWAQAAEVRSGPVDRTPTGRRLTAGEIVALFGACRCFRTGDRDAAILGLAFGAGLRRAEVASLRVEECNLSEAGPEIEVTGKGRRKRKIPLPVGAADALRWWLGQARIVGGWCFPGSGESGHISADLVWYICLRLAKKAGVRTFSPHDLRRSFASALFDGGADSRQVQRLLGHSRVDSVERYDLRDRAALRRAVDRLHVPFSLP